MPSALGTANTRSLVTRFPPSLNSPSISGASRTPSRVPTTSSTPAAPALALSLVWTSTSLAESSGLLVRVPSICPQDHIFTPFQVTSSFVSTSLSTTLDDMLSASPPRRESGEQG